VGAINCTKTDEVAKRVLMINRRLSPHSCRSAKIARTSTTFRHVPARHRHLLNWISRRPSEISWDPGQEVGKHNLGMPHLPQEGLTVPAPGKESPTTCRFPAWKEAAPRRKCQGSWGKSDRYPRPYSSRGPRFHDPAVTDQRPPPDFLRPCSYQAVS